MSYSSIAATLNKQPTTLVRMYLSSLEGDSPDYFLFSEKGAPLFPGARPYLDKDVHLSQEIKDEITLNSRITLTFHEDYSNGMGWWRKQKAIDYTYPNKRVEILKGFVGLTEGEYIVGFKGVLQNIRIKNNGMVEVIAKGLLQLTDKEIPRATDGKLDVGIGSSDTTLSLIVGTDMSQYDNPSGYLRIDDEIIYYTGISDTTFTGLSRGTHNGDSWGLASIHETDTAVQQVEVYDETHPVDTIADLLDKVGLPSADTDTASFAYVRDNWLANQKVRVVLDTPTSVKKYLKELREAFFLSLWQGEDQKLHLTFLGPLPPGAQYKEIKDDTEIIIKSVFLDDGEDKRITRVKVYYNLRGTETGSDPYDYRNQVIYVNGDSEGDYGEEKTKTIKSRWLRSDLGAESLAKWVAANYTRVLANGRSTLSFSVETKDDDLQVGDVFKLTSDYLLDSSGNVITDIKFQVLKKEQTGINTWKYLVLDTRMTVSNVVKTRTYGFITPSAHPDYMSSSTAEREYAYIGEPYSFEGGDLARMSNADPGYYIF